MVVLEFEIPFAAASVHLSYTDGKKCDNEWLIVLNIKKSNEVIS